MKYQMNQMQHFCKVNIHNVYNKNGEKLTFQKTALLLHVNIHKQKILSQLDFKQLHGSQKIICISMMPSSLPLKQFQVNEPNLYLVSIIKILEKTQYTSYEELLCPCYCKKKSMSSPSLPNTLKDKPICFIADVIRQNTIPHMRNCHSLLKIPYRNSTQTEEACSP